jgi:hypothetical protein
VRHPTPGRAGVIGFLGALALIGGGAAAVSFSGGHSSQAPTAQQSTVTTAPTASSELDALGLPRIEPKRIVERETFGRLRILSAGQPVEWDSSFEPQANLQAGETPVRNDGKSGLASADGSDFDPALPAGFTIEESGSLAKQVDGQTTFVSGAMRLAKEGEPRAITLEYWKLRPDAVVEITALSGSSVWDMSQATGTTGFLQTMAPRADFESVLNADFVIGEIYLRLRAPGTSPEELLRLVSAIREELPE